MYMSWFVYLAAERVKVQDDAIILRWTDPNMSQLDWAWNGTPNIYCDTVMGERSELCILYDHYDRYCLRDNVLWQWQVGLPKSIRENAIQSLHDISSHLYQKKTKKWKIDIPS